MNTRLKFILSSILAAAFALSAQATTTPIINPVVQGVLTATNAVINLANSTNLPGSGVQAGTINSNRFDAATLALLGAGGGSGSTNDFAEFSAINASQNPITISSVNSSSTGNDSGVLFSESSTNNDTLAGIFGGRFGTIYYGSFSAIIGGDHNRIGGPVGDPSPYAWYDVILGGTYNTNWGTEAAVIAGESSYVKGIASIAAGTRAQATNDGTFVWADRQAAQFGSTTTNQFLIRAQNGVGINTPDPGTNGLKVNGYIDSTMGFRIGGVPLSNTSSNGGTVTEVATGYGLTGGPININGTLAVNTNDIATRDWATAQFGAGGGSNSIGYGLTVINGTIEVMGASRFAAIDTAFNMETATLIPTDIGLIGAGEYIEAGISFTPSRDLVVTELGRWIISGSTNMHTLTLYGPGTTVIDSVTFDANTNAPGDFAYFPIAPATLTAGTTYTITSTEAPGISTSDYVPWFTSPGSIGVGLGITNAFDALRTNAAPNFDSQCGGGMCAGTNGYGINFKVTYPEIIDHFATSNLQVWAGADLRLSAQRLTSSKPHAGIISTNADNGLGVGAVASLVISSDTLAAEGPFAVSALSVGGSGDGSLFLLVNQSSQPMTLRNHGTHTGSYFDFETYKAADLLMTNGTVQFRFDGESNRWSIVSVHP